MRRQLISRAVLTDLREYFVSHHVLRTIQDSFGNEGIKPEPSKAPAVPGERRQLVEEYYASLDFSDATDVQRLLRIIEREMVRCQPDSSGDSPLASVVVGLEQGGYRVDRYKISFTYKTPFVSLQGYLGLIDSQSIVIDWERMLTTADIDPGDAITSARAVLESTCKAILEELGVPYEDRWDAGRLYKEAARVLQLSPDSYHEQVFRQILSGLFSVSSGLAEVRNALGDAHGKGKSPVRPTSRHARLAVNGAATLVVFLLETLEARESTGG